MHALIFLAMSSDAKALLLSSAGHPTTSPFPLTRIHMGAMRKSMRDAHEKMTHEKMTHEKMMGCIRICVLVHVHVCA